MSVSCQPPDTASQINVRCGRGGGCYRRMAARGHGAGGAPTTPPCIPLPSGGEQNGSFDDRSRLGIDWLIDWLIGDSFRLKLLSLNKSGRGGGGVNDKPSSIGAFKGTYLDAIRLASSMSGRGVARGAETGLAPPTYTGKDWTFNETNTSKNWPVQIKFGRWISAPLRKSWLHPCLVGWKSY